MPYRPGRHFLQIPGPTNVPDRVLRAMARPTIDHRGPEFQALGRELLDGIRDIFQAQTVACRWVRDWTPTVDCGSTARLSATSATSTTLPHGKPTSWRLYCSKMSRKLSKLSVPSP